MISARISLPLVLALVAGCTAPTSGEQQIELGTGTWQFEALVDGQEVDLVRGAQGGWHVWLGVRATHYDGDRALATIEMQPADERTEAQRVQTQLYFGEANADDQRDFVGWPAIIAEPSCVVGELMRISIEVESPDGTRGVDERYVVIGPGADPPDPCE